MAAIIVAIASVLGIAIISFSDFGEEVAAPVREVKETVQAVSPIIFLVGGLWLYSQLS